MPFLQPAALHLFSRCKVASCSCFRGLFCRLRSLTVSTVSSSKSSKHLYFGSPPNKTICPYNYFIRFFAENRRYLQSLLLFKKVLSPLFLKPEIFVFPSLLKSCVCLPHPNAGFILHGYILKFGFGDWIGARESLMLMYVKFRQTRDAYQVFEEMPTKTADLCNYLLCTFGSNGFYEGVVLVFEQMLEFCFLPHLDSISHAIVACGELRSMDKGVFVHDFVIQNGLSAHIHIANLLIAMYVKLGRLDFGQQVFNCMHDRDIVSWNSLITGYAHSGNWAKAFDIFLRLKKVGTFFPNRITFLGLVLACGQAGSLDLGKSLHGHLICSGLLFDFRLGTAVVDMYAKCGRVDYACTIFEDDFLEKSLVTWNSLIAGYSQNGYDHEAALLFEEMIVESNPKPDSVTLANVVPAYASLANIGRIQSIHALIVKKGIDLDGDVVLGTALVDAYGKCSDIKAAKSLFACIRKPNTATWNAMISGYNLNHHAERGMVLFIKMLRNHVLPDAITMVMFFQSCGELRLLKQGNMAHGYCILKGFSLHLTVANAMLDMYIRCGCVESSERLFSSMWLKNVVTWNTMLSGYVKIGKSAMAMSIFCQMQLENIHKPDPVTMISFVQASTVVFASHGVEIAQGYIVKLGFESETLVMNSLIDAYAKNGLIENARTLFMQMGQLRDQSSWNVMISGCGINGLGREACGLLYQMEEGGFKPNSITFTSLLSSCSHSGMVDEGSEYFHMMVTKYNLPPSLEHWTCIIDMFGRAGRLEEAYQLINSVHHQNFGCGAILDCDAVWGALLSACRTNINVELGELAGEKLLKLAPSNCGYHMLLSNLYSSSERWSEAARVRGVFEEGWLTKKPGLSML
ncbi:pentatricopeptide repeat-containing protein At4g19191, mitochondrial-like [Malania oleifera]|uniref:pentatricopeptide repeat-containing protein At4g19191, mitochondrial-like n=1 Tax=Malania oleifera TaxID=397392 RepID=UPI0025AE2A2A|nr:pentatricopeptide repeat-containing protein At4g19191, mitochondrial-like [Malania oleifera]XP_057958376.1 pentatricopeptide repeat-containing protein At4g19191, mitochondrial-like [Malania oleifera]XP_057958377.1 pentatricopeptide repeat-containing protein At4g19191, mitochondrial-like [Malania oleifera]XP_057958378.1 pentatricopeptide repeat-containing protein At4g19191, mitochondrial-like [Malania oleifera]XP_057958379.1 pentatricopeptide repeat-containing protein At4g19191, mitochondrial